MNGVAQLKGKHGVSLHLFEAGPQLARRQAELVQTVAPGDATQHLQVAAHQPVAAGQDLTDVGMVGVGRSKLASTPFLL